jgi:hypothetical protein
MLPPLPITLLPSSIFVAEFPEPIGEWFASAGKIGETFEKVAHRSSLIFACAATTAGICSPITGKRRTSVV